MTPLFGTSEAAGLMFELKFDGGRAVLAGAVDPSIRLVLDRGLKLELVCAGSLTGEAKPGLGCAKTIGLLPWLSGSFSICESFLLNASKVKFVSSGAWGSSGMFNGPFNSSSTSLLWLLESRRLMCVLLRVGVSSNPSIDMFAGGGVGLLGTLTGV